MALRNPAYGPPPLWFFDVYDSIQQGIPLGDWSSIRKQPLYQRYRYRFVSEALKENRMKVANKAKAQAMFDLSNF